MTTPPDFATLRAALLDELNRALTPVDSNDLAHLRTLLRQATRIFIAGKGRSGLVMRAFAMRLMHLGRPAYVVDDVTTPAIAPGDLLLIGSGSGRTASLVQYAARANEVGAYVALITGAPESPIHIRCACTVQIAASTPKLATGYDRTASVQPMGALFEQALLLLLDLLIVQLMHELGQDTDSMFSRHANLE